MVFSDARLGYHKRPRLGIGVQRPSSGRYPPQWAGAWSGESACHAPSPNPSKPRPQQRVTQTSDDKERNEAVSGSARGSVTLPETPAEAIRPRSTCSGRGRVVPAGLGSPVAKSTDWGVIPTPGDSPITHPPATSAPARGHRLRRVLRLGGFGSQPVAGRLRRVGRTRSPFVSRL